MTATAFLVSCEQGPSGLGAEVLPANDLVGVVYTDTIPLSLTTVVNDSANTYQASAQLLGNYVDPQFGTITAKTFTQVFPRSGLNFGDPADLIFDSLILKVTFTDAYGRLEQPQTLRVHEITGDWPDTTVIYSNNELDYNSEDIGDGSQINFNANSVQTGTLRIRLNDELGERILFGDSTILADRDRFRDEVMKGLVLETDPVKFVNREPGAIFSLFGQESDSLLILHYQKFNPDSQKYVSFKEPFVITNSTPRYHSLSRSEIGGTIYELATAEGDTSQQYELLQSGLVTKTWVQFPTLEFDQPYLVAKATIILPVDPDLLGTQDRYEPPFQILALRADENGNEIIIDNLGQSVSSSTTAITYDPDRQAYEIPITGYLQRLYNQTIEGDSGFTILPLNARSSVSRAILAGTNHPNPDLRPKLELTLGSVPR